MRFSSCTFKWIVYSSYISTMRICWDAAEVAVAERSIPTSTIATSITSAFIALQE